MCVTSFSKKEEGRLETPGDSFLQNYISDVDSTRKAPGNPTLQDSGSGVLGLSLGRPVHAAPSSVFPEPGDCHGAASLREGPRWPLASGRPHWCDRAAVSVLVRGPRWAALACHGPRGTWTRSPADRPHRLHAAWAATSRSGDTTEDGHSRGCSPSQSQTDV